MIEKGLLNYLSEKLGIANIGYIEKDLLLQGFLVELAQSNYFSENYCFKGGTCLTKAYFGYYRFSEDLDFTWIHQEQFSPHSQKQVRKKISAEINRLLGLLEPIAKKNGFDFQSHKSDKRYVQLGGSNRFTTFKFWYFPAESTSPSFVKIQVNFLEKLAHTPKKRLIKAIGEEFKQEIEFLYPQQGLFATKSAQLFTYDLREIAAEKIRAILTRRGFKERDIVDLYQLSKKGITFAKIRSLAIQKTRFMLQYLKYRQNLDNKQFSENLLSEKENTLLIRKPEPAFKKFAVQTLCQLNELAQEIRGGAK